MPDFRGTPCSSVEEPLPQSPLKKFKIKPTKTIIGASVVDKY